MYVKICHIVQDGISHYHALVYRLWEYHQSDLYRPES